MNSNNTNAIHILMTTNIKAYHPSVTLEHAVHQISQRAPEILATSKIVLVYE